MSGHAIAALVSQPPGPDACRCGSMHACMHACFHGPTPPLDVLSVYVCVYVRVCSLRACMHARVRVYYLCVRVCVRITWAGGAAVVLLGPDHGGVVATLAFSAVPFCFFVARMHTQCLWGGVGWCEVGSRVVCFILVSTVPPTQ